ncbi:hypothetical protein BVG79_01562 [Ketogulonicigenium robustum]|uniref:Uncharacterized protein n=1 Tax=Ketogulonicigenium robustum TaxID=92947 RepID=A0A1W6P064_9RHOB|nr:hypothetical protein BVG79_01562 [Ketogulonicigenium robustum]
MFSSFIFRVLWSLATTTSVAVNPTTYGLRALLGDVYS